MRLFESTASEFTTNGIGTIADAVSCYVTQTLNGAYELQMGYPITGMRYSDIQLRNIIVASVDPVSAEQPFRIYRVSKPLNGIVQVYARHIAYDLDGIVDAPFSADNIADALTGLVGNAYGNCPFTFDTDKALATPFALNTPSSIWGILSGVQGSILDTYGGEFEFNGMEVYLHTRRGTDRGVTIAYGKNLTSFQQDENNSNVYTGVYPFWTNEETVVTLPEQVINASGVYDFTRILSLDLSAEFETEPTEAELRSRATAYINDNNIGVPKVSWTISFAMLEQSEEYRNSTILTRVVLGDTVHVKFPRYNVTASARVVTVKWLPLLSRYDSVTLGSVRANLAQTIAVTQKDAEEKPSTSHVQTIASALAKGLLGAKDGFVRILDTNNDGSPDELIIADSADPATAVKIWRFNYMGWAASSDGGSTWSMGATLEDGLLADFVTAARLTAGTIQSADGSTFFLDLDNGILNMDVSSLKLEGQDMSVIIQGAADAGTEAAQDVQDDLDALKAHIVIGNDGSMTFIGAQGNPITLKLTNDSLQILNGDAVMDTFGVGGTTTENLTIPTTGSLTMEPYKWVSRSNGHLQLVFVG